MNKKITRALSSLLAFIMLLSCMTVVNVSSVWAADVTNTVTTKLPVGDYTFNSSTTENINKYFTYSAKKFESSDIALADGHSLKFTPAVEGTCIVEYSGKTPTLDGDKMTSSPYSFAVLADQEYAIAGTSAGTSQIKKITLKTSVGTTDPDPDPAQYTVTIDNGTNGTVTVKDVDGKEVANNGTVAENTVITINATADTGYKVEKITANGETVETVENEGTYKGTHKVIKDTTIEVIYVKDNEQGGGETSTTGSTYIHNFTTDNKESKFYTISGSLATNKGTVTYDKLNLTQCLKMESSTSISFTAKNKGTLTLVFGGTTSASGQKVKVDGTACTVGLDGTYTIDLEKGDHTVTKGGSINLFYMSFVEEGGTVTPTTAALTITETGATGGTIKVDGEDVVDAYEVGKAVSIAVTAPTGYEVASVTANSTTLTATNGVYSYTVKDENKIVITYTKVVVVASTTVTVYDSTTQQKITGDLYYWTINTKTSPKANEYKLSNTSGVIDATAIKDGKVEVDGAKDSNNTEEQAKARVISDMTEALAKKKLYVTAVGYAGAEVTLVEDKNVNVQLTPLPSVNINEAGVYSVDPVKVADAIIAVEPNASYLNPYFTSAQVNGFTMAAGANGLIKIMSQVNTRNEDHVTAKKEPYAQFSKGCTVTYTPARSGKLTVVAASTSTDAKGRGYTVSGDGITNGVVTLSGTTYDTKVFDNLQADKTYTLTVTNSVAGDNGGINIKSIVFTPEAVPQYTLTYTDDEKVSVTVNGTAATSGNEYDENSQVTVKVTPEEGKKAVVKVNGVAVELTDNSHTFTLGKETSIAVEYVADETGSDKPVDDSDLKAIQVGTTIDLTKQEGLVAKNTALTASEQVKYYAESVTGAGSTAVIRLKNDSSNFVEFKADENNSGTVAISYGNSPIDITDVTTGTKVTTLQNTAGSSDIVTGTFNFVAGHTYKITNETKDQARIYSIALSAASSAVAGNNIASINSNEVIKDTNILTAYGVTDANVKAVRIVGQLNGVTEANAETVDATGIVVLNCTLAQWEKNGLSDTNIVATIDVNNVYVDVYSTAGFDNSKVTESGTYTGTSMGLSKLNTYFDVLVYGADSDFTGSAACTFTTVNDKTDYYNSQAQLAGIDFN